MPSADTLVTTEWAAEDVQDFRDAGGDLPLLRNHRGSMRGAASDIGGSCSSRSFVSHAGDAGVANEFDAMNLDQLLQAWVAQEGLREEAAAAAAAGGAPGAQVAPPGPAPAGVPSQPQGPVPRLALDWLLQVAQPSIGEETVEGASVDSPYMRAPRPESAPDMRLFTPAGVLPSYGGLTGDREASDTTTSQESAYGHFYIPPEASSNHLAMGSETVIEGEEEDVVSVFDMSDEPPSARAGLPADTRALLGELAPRPESAGTDIGGADGGAAVVQEVLGMWGSSSPMSGRSPIASRPTTRERSETQLLERSFGNMLRRLALESQLRDDEVSRNVRRVLQLGAILPGQGLSQDQLASLPQVVCQPAMRGQQCSICLDGYQVGEVLTVLPCSHSFHTDCVSRWVQRCAHCPLCRTHCGTATVPEPGHSEL